MMPNNNQAYAHFFDTLSTKMTQCPSGEGVLFVTGPATPKAFIEALNLYKIENNYQCGFYKVSSPLTNNDLKLLKQFSDLYNLWVDCCAPSLLSHDIVNLLIKEKNLSYFILGAQDHKALSLLYGHLDVPLLKAITRHLTQALEQGSQARITTDLGTDLSYALDPNHLVVSDTCDLTSPGIHFPPAMTNWVHRFGSANGTLVFDVFYDAHKIKGLLKTPLTFEIVNSSITDIKGDPQITGPLMTYLESYKEPSVYKVGDSNIGLVKGLSIQGTRHYDERSWGNMNIGFGSVHPEDAPPKGQVSPAHMDGVLRKPKLYIDGRLIMSDGVFHL